MNDIHPSWLTEYVVDEEFEKLKNKCLMEMHYEFRKQQADYWWCFRDGNFMGVYFV